MSSIIGAIDAGGTTFKCAVINDTREILAYERVPTTTPEATFKCCKSFFDKHDTVIDALGIACFGPLNRDRASDDFGQIHNTPKPGWSGTNPYTWFKEHLCESVSIDTDVNAALLAEREWGAAKNTDTSVYITVGTGIGAGIFANGDLVGGINHPEFGHIAIEPHKDDLQFPGLCSFHGNCLEGMASAKALTARFDNPKQLPSDHIGWTIIADYMAQACQVLILTIRPDRILLGGGLMQAEHIIPQIRSRLSERLNKYAGISETDILKTISSPELGDDAGLFGGALLAKLVR